jgi:hypothetical protein
MPDHTIYVALRDEGVDVWRPVRCEQHTDGTLPTARRLAQRRDL